MVGFVRLVIFGFIGLSVIYVCLSLYSRSVRKEKLEEQWDREKPTGVTREVFVKRGIEEYNTSLRPKLLLLVYVVPVVVTGAIIYLTNMTT